MTVSAAAMDVVAAMINAAKASPEMAIFFHFFYHLWVVKGVINIYRMLRNSVISIILSHTQFSKFGDIR